MKKTVPLAILFLLSAIGHSMAEGWKAGTSSLVITPEKPLWMAGYASRKIPAQKKTTELYGKVLALESGPERAVLITLDLVGVGRDFATDLRRRLGESCGLANHQIAIATSHTHSGPVVGKNLAPLHYLRLDEAQQRDVDDYTESLKTRLVDGVREALDRMEPAILQYGSGKAAFAVNRRENKPYAEVESRRARGLLRGPVDHDVPVLTVRDSDHRLEAIVFGYACHATVLSASAWNGDYPGYAQAELEKRYPGATALFWAGCGGDQNPLPRSTVPLAEEYGRDLARAVSDVIRSPMSRLGNSLELAYREIHAPLATLPTIREIRESQTSKNVFEVARARFLLKKISDAGALDSHYPYPVGFWRLGEEIDWVFLGGEVVVDYAKRIKRERSGTRTWVTAYANDVMAYIPSLRVLKEGGYEGGGSNVYYGLPTLWDESIEETIVEAVHELAP